MGNYYMIFSSYMVVAFAAVLISQGVLAAAAAAKNSSCFFEGRWVADKTYPLFDSAACPFIGREFSCLRNGRLDRQYLQYRWQPARYGCDLRRFDGKKFLEGQRGKSIMFVGDSLSRNQWTSLVCMLYTAVPKPKYRLIMHGDLTTFTLTEYNVKVIYHRTMFLMEIATVPKGRILKLNKVIEGGKPWLGIDMLIFNTYQWWGRKGPKQPWDFIQNGTHILKDVDRTVAFEEAMTTWARWVDANIDPTKSKVFFQGISPSHYVGKDWNEPNATTCQGQEEPTSGPAYPGGLPTSVTVMKKALSNVKKPVVFLDITLLSLLRKDGHPSVYGMPGRAMDCTHWCVAGVTDTWNEILYNLISF